MSQAAAAVEQYRRGFTPAVTAADFNEQVFVLQRFFDDDDTSGEAEEEFGQLQQQTDGVKRVAAVFNADSTDGLLKQHDSPLTARRFHDVRL